MHFTEEELEIVSDCAICGTDDSVIDDFFGRRLSLQSPFACRQCRRCGLRWLSPRPTEAAYLKLYTRKNYFGGSHAEEDYEAIVASRLAIYRDRLQKIRKIRGATKRERLLDVGAATGDFVKEALSYGFDAEGVELSEEARDMAKKKCDIDLYAGSLVNLSGGGEYDILHIHHVFEHVPDPNDFLKMCSQLLSKTGLLVIEVPQQVVNDLDKVKVLLQCGHILKKFGPYSLHHTYFYTPITLSLLLRMNGFRVVSLRTANPCYTPLWPFKIKNIVLRLLLWTADFVHQGGNIIEIFALKEESLKQ